MRPSFVRVPQPFIVGVINDSNPDACIASIRNCECAGAQAFDLHLSALEKQYLNEADLKKIIMSTDKPMLMLFYRPNIQDYRAADGRDAERIEVQLMAVRAGASACDITGDSFDPSPRQLTKNPAAIERQLRLIDKIHSMGAEVLMSTHAFEYINTDEAVAQLKALEARGADMVKLAMVTNTQEELVGAMATTVALKRQLKAPFAHICMGQYGKLHRFIGPMLGSALTFTVCEYSPRTHKEQPLTRAVREVWNNIDYKAARSATED